MKTITYPSLCMACVSKSHANTIMLTGYINFARCSDCAYLGDLAQCKRSIDPYKKPNQVDVFTIRWECEDLAIYFNHGFLMFVQNMKNAYQILDNYIRAGYTLFVVESED